MSAVPFTTHQIEIDCPEAGKTITAIITKHEHRERQSGKHLVDSKVISPKNCSEKLSCKYWHAPLHCPLYHLDSSGPAVAHSSECQL